MYTDKFSIADGTGNTSIAGSLNVTCATNFINLTTLGVVHNSGSGLLSTILILPADLNIYIYGFSIR